MSCSNLCKTTSTEPIHKNIDNSTCSLNHSKQAVNIVEGDAISCVFNADPSAGKTILITNCSHNDDLKSAGTHNSPLKFSTNNNVKNKSSITIYTHSSDSEIPNKLQGALPTPAINILISNHFEHPTSRSLSHDGVATSTMTTATSAASATAAAHTKTIEPEQKMPQLGEPISKLKPLEVTHIKTELPNSPEPKVDNKETIELDSASRPQSKALSNSTADVNCTQTDDSMACTNADFSSGDDVLIQERNSKFYLGTMIDYEKDKYKIKFYDESVKWSPADKVGKLLSPTKENAIFCIICKKDGPDRKVDVCDRCGRGYHRECFPAKYLDSDSFKCLR